MARRVRVLLIAPSLEIVGGQSVQADRLLIALRNEPGIEVEFLPINPRLPGPLRLLQRVKYVRTAATLLSFLFKLLLRVGRADVIHTFAATGPSFFMNPVPAMLAAKLFGKKTILHFHDGRAESYLTRRPGAAVWIARFDAVVTPSGYLVEVFARHSVRARPIFNLIDTESFTFRERAHPRPLLLHNRGLEPLYNVACTLRAFAEIQRCFPGATLTLAHDGPLRGELEQLARDLELRNVSFLGYISRSDTARVLNDADIYLTSPSIDNMPVSLLECFAAGLPVVATRVGGIPWVVEDGRTGLLASDGDHQALAAAAMRLLKEPELALRLTTAARAECEKYRWQAVREEWLGLYQNLAGNAVAPETAKIY